MTEQVCHHKSTIGMSTHCDPISIDIAEGINRINCRCRVSNKLLPETVVRLLAIFTHDRKSCIVEYRKTPSNPKYWAAIIRINKLTGIRGILASAVFVLVFYRVGPHQQRQFFAFAKIIARRQV